MGVEHGDGGEHAGLVVLASRLELLDGDLLALGPGEQLVPPGLHVGVAGQGVDAAAQQAQQAQAGVEVGVEGLAGDGELVGCIDVLE